MTEFPDHILEHKRIQGKVQIVNFNEMGEEQIKISQTDHWSN